MTHCGLAHLPFADKRGVTQDRGERRPELVGEHREELVLGFGRLGQSQGRFFELPGAVVLAQQRVAEDPQQLAAQRQPGALHRELLSRRRPDVVEGKPAIAGESHDFAVAEMGGQRVPCDRRPHDRPGENERGTDHRDPVLLFDDDRRARSRSAQAPLRACGEHPRATTLGEKVEQRCAIHGSRHETPIGAVDLDGQVVDGRVLLERDPAAIELKDGDVQICQRGLPPARRGVALGRS